MKCIIFIKDTFLKFGTKYLYAEKLNFNLENKGKQSTGFEYKL